MSPAMILLLLAAAVPEGSVIQVVPGRAYLDRGADDGLSAGMPLRLLRGGRDAGSCTVEIVAPHHATCRGQARAGDRFALPPPAATAPPPAVLPPPPGAAEVSERRSRLEEAPAPWVVDRASPAAVSAERRFHAGAELGAAVWSTFDGHDYEQARLDAVLINAPVLGPFKLDASVSAQYWAMPDNARYRPGTQAMLFVYDLELSTRAAGVPYVLSLGRVNPWFTPGVTMFDGAQAGWRSGDVEVGAYGGGLPRPETLAPAFDDWTGGLYGSFAHSSASGFLPYWRLDVRGGATRVATIGTRQEAEAEWLSTLAKQLVLDAGLHLQTGAGLSGISVAFGKVELTASAEPFRFSGGFRYLDGPAAQFELARTYVVTAPSRHADAQIAWDISPWVSVTALGGLAADLSSSDARRWVGPNVTFPRALGSHGSVSLGYLQEFGWLHGRSAWVQSTYLPSEAFQISGRLSYYQDASSVFGSENFHDVGLLVSVDGRIAAHLRLAATAMARTELAPASDTTPAGLLADLSLKGDW